MGDSDELVSNSSSGKLQWLLTMLPLTSFASYYIIINFKYILYNFKINGHIEIWTLDTLSTRQGKTIKPNYFVQISLYTLEFWG